MNTALGIVGGLVVGAGIGWGVATQGSKLGLGGAGSGGTMTGGSDAALFTLDGKTFSEKDLPTDVRSQIFEMRSESQERMDAALTQFALQLGLAKEKNKDAKPDQLPPFDELLGVPKPTEDEVQALYEANKARLPANLTYEQVKPEIERFVTNQKSQEALRTKTTEFQTSNRLKLLTVAPVAPVVTIDLSGFPVKGTAAHTLVEASDYLCPHCQATQPEVEALQKEMGDKLRFVQVNFSLNPTGLSGTLARGAFCAQKDGDAAFWKYHETAFKTAQEKGWKSSDPSADEPLTEVATAAGLDAAKLVACAGTPEATAAVQTAHDRMEKLGVTATPTFYLNGRKLLMKKSLLESVNTSLQASSH